MSKPKNNLSSLSKLALTALAVAALSACGGGGGGAAGGNTGTGGDGEALPPVTAPEIVDSVPAMTYAAGSGEAAAIEVLNEERERCGFGLLAQNEKLDLAAQDAQDYWKLRLTESQAAGDAFQHEETLGLSGFTGASPGDRMRYRGYDVSLANENVSRRKMAAPTGWTHAATAVDHSSALLTTVYHLQSLMAGYRDVGIAYEHDITTIEGYWNSSLRIKLGTEAGTSTQSATGLRTFPCQGTVYAYAEFTPSAEVPNPAPDLGALTIGTPIYLTSAADTTLTVTSFSIAPTAGGAPTAGRVLSQDNDSALGSNQAFILPLSKLVAGIEYRVSVETHIDGVAQAPHVFTFTPA